MWKFSFVSLSFLRSTKGSLCSNTLPKCGLWTTGNAKVHMPMNTFLHITRESYRSNSTTHYATTCIPHRTHSQFQTNIYKYKFPLPSGWGRLRVSTRATFHGMLQSFISSSQRRGFPPYIPLPHVAVSQLQPQSQ